MSRPHSSATCDDIVYESDDHLGVNQLYDRANRSNAPSPVPDPTQMPIQPREEVVREGRPTPAPIDTSVEDEIEYIPFNVQDFEDRHDPLMFTLEYTEKSNNYPIIRHEALIPEKYIERMIFKSPCLSHSHQVDHEGAPQAKPHTTNRVYEHFDEADGDAMDIDEAGSYSGEPDNNVIESSESTTQDSSETESSDWENDPSYQAFLRRLDQTAHLREHRLHPVSKYVHDEIDCEGCRIIPFPTDKPRSIKKELNNKDFKALERRHLSAEVDLAEEDHWDGRECPICGLAFKSQVGESKATTHWFEHHQLYITWMSLEWRKVISAAKDQGEDPFQALSASGLTINPILEYKIGTSSKSSNENFTRDKFYYMEQVCNRAENEVLEREEFCRVCYQTFPYGDASLTEHYQEHKQQESQFTPTVSLRYDSLSPETNAFVAKVIPGGIKKRRRGRRSGSGSGSATSPKSAQAKSKSSSPRTSPKGKPRGWKSAQTVEVHIPQPINTGRTVTKTTESVPHRGKKRKASDDLEYADSAPTPTSELEISPILRKPKKRSFGDLPYRLNKRDESISPVSPKNKMKKAKSRNRRYRKHSDV